jgi:hypothetical protein
VWKSGNILRIYCKSAEKWENTAEVREVWPNYCKSGQSAKCRTLALLLCPIDATELSNGETVLGMVHFSMRNEETKKARTLDKHGTQQAIVNDSLGGPSIYSAYNGRRKQHRFFK